MPKEWLVQRIKYDSNIVNADIVMSLGQQTHPALKDFIQNYALKNKLNIVVQQGSCGVTAGKLRRKSIDIAAYCCPLANSDRLPSLQLLVLRR